MATTLDRVQKERDAAAVKILNIARSLEQWGVNVDDINLLRDDLGSHKSEIIGVEIMVSIP